MLYLFTVSLETGRGPVTKTVYGRARPSCPMAGDRREALSSGSGRNLLWRKRACGSHIVAEEGSVKPVPGERCTNSEYDGR